MMWFIIHTVRLDIITTIDQHRHDTITTTDRRHLIITIRIMAIAINLASSIDLIAINRSDHLISDRLRRSVIINLPQREDADKKCNEI